MQHPTTINKCYNPYHTILIYTESTNEVSLDTGLMVHTSERKAKVTIPKTKNE